MQTPTTIVEFYTPIVATEKIVETYDRVLHILQTSSLMARQKNQVTPVAINTVKRFGKDRVQGRILIDGQMSFKRWDELVSGITFRQEYSFEKKFSLQCIGFQVDPEEYPSSPSNFGNNNNDGQDNNHGPASGPGPGPGSGSHYNLNPSSNQNLNPNPKQNQNQRKPPNQGSGNQRGNNIFSNQDQHINEGDETVEKLQKSAVVLETATEADTDADTNINFQQPENKEVKMEIDFSQAELERPKKTFGPKEIIVLDSDEDDDDDDDEEEEEEENNCENQQEQRDDTNTNTNMNANPSMPYLYEVIQNAHESQQQQQQQNRDSNPFENRVERITIPEPNAPISSSQSESEGKTINDILLLKQNLEKIGQLAPIVSESSWDRSQILERILISYSQMQLLENPYLQVLPEKSSRLHKVIQKDVPMNSKEKGKARSRKK